MTTTLDGMTGLRLIRVEMCEGTIQETGIFAREIVRVAHGSVYEIQVNDYTAGYLKLIVGADDRVKSYAQKSRDAGRIFLGTDLDFSDAVSEALGVL